jgi:hypothetical protein
MLLQRLPLLAGWLAALCLLAGCAAVPGIEQEASSLGGTTPEEATADFVQRFNEALQDPALTELETRRIWAERLASYFAPSERVDQRYVLQRMLASFAAGMGQLEADQHMTLEISYSALQVMDESRQRATVRLVDGTLRFRRVRVTEDERRIVLLDQQRPLAQTLGLQQGTVPLVQVNGRWFLTEH